MRSTITRAIIILICIAFLISMIIALFLRSKQPKYKGERELPGLKEDAEVLFDSWAIPHVYANTENDAYRTLGFLHAQDRLFQMEMTRRLAKGELAEVLGPKALHLDKLFRTLGVRHIAEKLAKNKITSGPTAEAFQSFLSGVNEFIDKGPKPIEFQILGIEARPFEVSDSFAIAGYMAYSFLNSLRTDPLIHFIDQELGAEFKKEILPEHKTELSSHENIDVEFLKDFTLYAESLVQGPFQIFEGSNAWVISGKRTRSGKAILANDPHIAFAQPSVWYEAAFETPSLKLYGHYIPGVPVALLGHNDTHGWGVTMLQNKDSDFYKEKQNPQNENQFWFRDRWEEASLRTEVIKIKGEEDLILEIKSTRHGPIINGVVEGFKKLDSPVSFKWGFANEENGILDGFYEIARAKSRAEAQNAVSKIHSPGINVVYADAKGEIAWWTVGRFPIRPAHAQGKFLLEGDTGKDEHLGYYPFSSHPMSVNPPEGFIVSANQNPFRNHPYAVDGYYNPDFRYDAIREILSSKDSAWTVEDMKKIQLETQGEGQKRILGKILSVLENYDTGKNDTTKLAFAILKNWDLQHSIESQGASIFHEILGNLVQKLFEEKLTPPFYESIRKTNLIHDALVRIMDNPESHWWKNKDGIGQQDDFIREAWDKTLVSLSNTLGSKAQFWNWGRVHTVVHKHVLGQNQFLAWLFNVGPLAANGSAEVVNNFNFVLGPGLHEVHAGPSTRRIVDFDNPGESWGINPTGQSGYFANAHYRDQASLFHQGQYRLQILERRALKKDAKRFVFLAPKKVGN